MSHEQRVSMISSILNGTGLIGWRDDDVPCTNALLLSFIACPGGAALVMAYLSLWVLALRVLGFSTWVMTRSLLQQSLAFDERRSAGDEERERGSNLTSFVFDKFWFTFVETTLQKP
jgi:hypothetical protein